jgi:probable F420-dependent oxidoreductase
MKLGPLGVWSPTDALTVPQLRELAQRTEQLGYGALWYPESRGHEAFALGSFLLCHTERLVIATGIANIYARDPTTARLGQHTLAKLSGGRFLLGLGVSHVPMVEGLRGHRYGPPVPTMRAYLDGMDKAADVAAALAEPPPRVLAALGPLMTRLGGQRATGIHPYNVTPEHTAWARGIVGPEPWVCVEQMVLLLHDPAKARAVARQNLALYLPMPNYRNNWLRLGFSEQELADGGSDRFVDAIVAWGDAAAIRRRIQQHLDAGANHVCIQPLHPSGQRIPHLEALEALAPKA